MELMENNIHHGRNIKKIRELMGIKQETLAVELGGDWTQKKVSILETKDEIEKPILEKIAGILKVPIEVIKNFDTEQAIQNINNVFHDNAIQNQFNPIEKIIELYEERIIVLYSEKIALYERMLEDKENLIRRLETILNK